MLSKAAQEIRDVAEANLYYFARLVNPHRVYGEIHKEIFDFWQHEHISQKGSDQTLVLEPRDHQKSHCAAVKAAWLLTRDPTKTILYLSSTSGLAVKQLKSIKDILTSDVYRRYWPEMVNKEEGKREQWTQTEISLDHPLRKAEGIRDSSVKTAGLTTSVTGFHASDIFLDDIVDPKNAYTEEGREKVKAQYSQLASIASTNASETVVGTIYHPDDIYQEMMDMTEAVFDDKGNVVGSRPVYKIKKDVVETDGVFLWPVEQAPNGKFYGFNPEILERKRAKYLDKTQFWAQYYLEANAPDSYRLEPDNFQYYDQKYIKNIAGQWYFKSYKLNVYAAVDLAFSLHQNADYTAIVVIGMDHSGNIYVLDIERFKANKISKYFEKIELLHRKWEFRKLRAEVNVAQEVIVNDLKDLIRKNGLSLSIDKFRPQQKKEERIAAVLEPRYENQSIWHFKGGYTSVLENELVLARPAHDDVKDSLASAIEIAKPAASKGNHKEHKTVVYGTRFGMGVAR